VFLKRSFGIVMTFDIAGDQNNYQQKYWSISFMELLRHFKTKQDKGLTRQEASHHLTKYGKNHTEPKKRKGSILLLIHQFKSPIIIIFIFTSILSLFLGQNEDAVIIIAIVIVSGILGFWQEKGATDAINKLLDIVQIKTDVLREGKVEELKSKHPKFRLTQINSYHLFDRIK
jgi:Mg2+-importing ATPase